MWGVLGETVEGNGGEVIVLMEGEGRKILILWSSWWEKRGEERGKSGWWAAGDTPPTPLSVPL